MNSDYKYIIYKIVNTVNKKAYIGKHKTKNVNDTYFGSGKILRLAIIKYGKENFTKEVIEYCIDDNHMSKREIYWIKNENSFSPLGYNINTGGKGGDNFTNNPNKEEIRIKLLKNIKPRIFTDEEKEACRIRMTGSKLPPHRKVKCIYCSKEISQANHNKWHGDYCISNPNKIVRVISYKECEFCNKKLTHQNYAQFHGDKCKHNPNRIEQIKEYKECEYCSKIFTIKGYNVYHGERCKQNPNYIPNKLIKRPKQTAESNIKRSNTLKGRIISDNQKIIISEYGKNRWKKIKEDNIIYKCEKCGLETINKVNYIRWHGDNCRK